MPPRRKFAAGPEEKCRRRINCSLCDYRCRDKYNLLLHLQSSKHSSTKKDFVCFYCGDSYLTKEIVKRHIIRYHTGNMASAGTRKFECPACRACMSKKELCSHFTVAHGINLVYEKMRFDSFVKFQVWKRKFEEETVSVFVTYATHKLSDGVVTKVFNCQRTGYASIKPSRQRIYKVREPGSNKIGGFCPARMNLKIAEAGVVEAVVCRTHVGHQQELGRVRLGENRRLILARKIAEGMTFEEILDEIRDSIQSNNLDRMHLATRKDLHNIAAQYGLKPKVKNDTRNRVTVSVKTLDSRYRQGRTRFRLGYDPDHEFPRELPHSKKSRTPNLHRSSTMNDAFMVATIGSPQVCLVDSLTHEEIRCRDSEISSSCRSPDTVAMPRSIDDKLVDHEISKKAEYVPDFHGKDILTNNSSPDRNRIESPSESTTTNLPDKRKRQSKKKSAITDTSSRATETSIQKIESKNFRVASNDSTGDLYTSSGIGHTKRIPVESIRWEIVHEDDEIAVVVIDGSV